MTTKKFSPKTYSNKPMLKWVSKEKQSEVEEDCYFLTMDSQKNKKKLLIELVVIKEKGILCQKGHYLKYSETQNGNSFEYKKEGKYEELWSEIKKIQETDDSSLVQKKIEEFKKLKQ